MSRLITTNKTTLTPMQSAAKQGGKLIFTDYQGQTAALLIRNDRLRAARFFPKEQSRIGAIYICKVKNVVPNLGAYFVEIGGEQHEICFLSKKDAAHPFLLNRNFDGRILEGDEFPVQVVKDAQKTKQASVTTLISISNDCFALSVGDTKTGYSNKFTSDEKAKLKQLLKAPSFSIPDISLPYKSPAGELLSLSVGLVVRTMAAQMESDDYLQNCFNDLCGQWQKIFQTAQHRTCFSCLKAAPCPWLSAVKELAYANEYDEVLSDNTDIYNQLMQADILGKDKSLRLYDETQSAQLSLSKLYSLESKIATALERRVWLKSGGYLIIDPTEALTVIDVNSGKYEARKGTEETAYLINKEAAEEVALQLRLRNISGIIVVDFINMKSQEHKNSLINDLKELVLSDKQKTTVVDMTALGLVEITRQKGYKPLREQINKL